MKKLTIIMLLILTTGFFAPYTSAQENSYSPKMVIKTNPLSALGGPFWVIIVPVTGEYRALVEIKTTAKQSVTIGGSYLGPSLLLNLDNITSDTSNLTGIKTSGYRIQAAYKFYITRTTEAPNGFYVGPHFSYAAARIQSRDNPDDQIGAIKMNFEGIIGYQLIAKSGFALDIYTGLGLKYRNWMFEGNSLDIFDIAAVNTFVPGVAFGFNFGFAF